jgi:hypothetical protein
MIAAGRPGPAMMSFLTEIIGLTEDQVTELRNVPRDYAVLPESTLAVLDGQGHDAIDAAPDLLTGKLTGFFSQ